MAFSAFLYVSKPVASLQLDLDTEGSITLDPSVQKQMATNRLPDGKLRVIIYGLDQSTFGGMFATVSQPVNSITNVVGANPDGSNAGVEVSKMSSPQGVGVTVIK